MNCDVRERPTLVVNRVTGWRRVLQTFRGHPDLRKCPSWRFFIFYLADDVISHTVAQTGSLYTSRRRFSSRKQPLKCRKC